MSDLVKGFQTPEGVKKYDYNSLGNLPSLSIPYFDLAAQGLGVITVGEPQTFYMDTTEIIEALNKGLIKVGFNYDMGNVVFGTAVLTPMYIRQGDAYQGTLIGQSNGPLVRVSFGFMPGEIQVTSEAIGGLGIQQIWLNGDEDSGYTCSHTFQEIFELVNEGPFPVLAYEGVVAYLAGVMQDTIDFHTIISIPDSSISFGIMFRIHRDESVEFLPFPIGGTQMISVSDDSGLTANTTPYEIAIMLEVGIMPVLYINGIFAQLIIASEQQAVFLATVPEESGIVQIFLSIDDSGNVDIIYPSLDSASVDDGVNTRSVDPANNSLSNFNLPDIFDLSRLRNKNIPVKGVDYWTEEDKQEIIDAVINALIDKEI